MKILFKNNPEYREAYTTKVMERRDGRDYVRNVSIYLPAGITQYHLSRMVAASAQNIYSNAGITKDLLATMLEKIIERCNNRQQPMGTVLTDIGTLANNLLYRTKYPLDEDCALRMGAIYSFVEGEDPDNVNPSFTQMKVDMAKEDAGLYDFFLTMGVQFTPAYKELQSLLSDSTYFPSRSTALESLIPPQ